VCGIETASDVDCDLSVHRVEGTLVGAGKVVGGTGKGVGEGGHSVERVAVRAAGERLPGGGSEPVVGAVPRAEAVRGQFDVQEHDSGWAVSKVLPVQGQRPGAEGHGVGVGEPGGDGVDQAERGVGGHEALALVRAVQARAAARAR
jgi:hypothetical protein